MKVVLRALLPPLGKPIVENAKVIKPRRRTQTLLKDGVDYVGLLGAVYNKPVASGIAGVRRAGIRPIIVLRIFTVFEHSIDRISAAIGHLKNLRDVGDTLGPLVARRAAKKLIVEQCKRLAALGSHARKEFRSINEQLIHFEIIKLALPLRSVEITALTMSRHPGLLQPIQRPRL